MPSAADRLYRLGDRVAEIGRLTLRQWHYINQTLERYATCDRCHLWDFCAADNAGIVAGVRGCDRYHRANTVAPPLDDDMRAALSAQLHNLCIQLRRAGHNVRPLFKEDAQKRHQLSARQELLGAAQALNELAAATDNVNLAGPWRDRWREYVVETGNRILRVGRALSKEAQWQRLHGPNR